MIHTEARGDALWIRIDRPEKRNALTVEGWHDLRAAFDRADDDPETRVAVVTGVEDVFSAGDDIGAIDDAESADEVAELGEALHDVLFGVESLSVPVVAAVNGLAYGGGCELVAACDLAVAVEGAKFAVPEAKIGAYPVYVVERVGAVLGRKRLMELALTGDAVDAETAKEWGLVNRVVAADELDATVEEFVEKIAESPALAIETAKTRAAASVEKPGERDALVGSLSQLRRDDASRRATREFLER